MRRRRILDRGNPGTDAEQWGKYRNQSGEAQKTCQQGYARKDSQKKQDDPKEGSEEGTASASTVEETTADRQTRGYAADQ